MNSVDPRALWQAQTGSTPPFTAAEIARRASLLSSRVGRRNRREYMAAALVVLIFGAYLIVFRHPLMQLGSALIMVAALFVIWRLKTHGTATPPEQAGSLAGVDAYRVELVRQRDLLRGVWLWYLAPFVPGFVLFLAGVVRLSRAPIGPRFAIVVVFCLLVFGGIAYLNFRGARLLQREIDSLEHEHE
jgi:hypothetical protein